MNADELLKLADALLEREREAIGRLDARLLEELAVEKTNLFRDLRSLAATDPVTRGRLAAVAKRVRENTVLLAYARDCVRESLGVVARTLNETTKIGQGFEKRRRGLRVNVSR